MSDKEHTDSTNQELEAQLKRALADYQNLQKRFDKEKQDVVRFANEALLIKMLGVVEGFDMVMAQFREMLDDHGFTKMEVQSGDTFDPNTMEAIDGEGTVVDVVYSYPYTLHDKVVQVARVSVKKK
ncbi:nucleotide exchange factor GrpE [candidate division WWE3 bacterium]|uniref:Nucleotide exchange factor GrpE n=1 Tax=candidate division WWE3 bacterium TaxID=2053526 RepID=A0A955LVP5_UNCKA|nr:nucleotide exchange factor GrpE [candidate division WWE3 bacterium]